MFKGSKNNYKYATATATATVCMQTICVHFHQSCRVHRQSQHIFIMSIAEKYIHTVSKYTTLRSGTQSSGNTAELNGKGKPS